MSFRDASLFWSPRPVDSPTPFDWRSGIDLIRPANHIEVGLSLDEFAPTVHILCRQCTVPRENSHIGDRIVVAAQKLAFTKTLIQHVKLTFDLQGKAVDCIFYLLWGVSIKMSKATPQLGSAAHLQEQPGHALRPVRRFGGQEFLKLLR